MRLAPVLAGATIAALLASCRPAAAPTDPARLSQIEERLERLELALTQAVTGADAKPATPEARLIRVEHRLDRLLAFLKQAVRPELDTSVTYAIPIDPSDPVLGPRDAKVTIVEAYEFLCPYCAMIAPTLEQLRARYPKDVRVVSKYFVIHGAPAEPAGRAACAAAKQGPAKYAALEKALWAAIWPEAGKPPAKERATEAEIEKLAKAAGLDVARFRADAGGADCRGWLTRSGDVLQRFGAGGTPSFYINGRSVSAGGLEDLAAVVDAEIDRVDASGTPAARYYEDVVLRTGAAEARMISPFDD